MQHISVLAEELLFKKCIFKEASGGNSYHSHAIIMTEISKSF